MFHLVIKGVVSPENSELFNAKYLFVLSDYSLSENFNVLYKEALTQSAENHRRCH